MRSDHVILDGGCCVVWWGKVDEDKVVQSGTGNQGDVHAAEKWFV